MYADYLKERFPLDERNGLFKAPELPAVKLGKILMKDRRVASPNDVIAMHLNSGTFSSSNLILTKDRCLYDDGDFMLEDVKEAQANGKTLIVFANQKGSLIEHQIKVKNDQVAKTLQKLFSNIAYYDAKAHKAVAKVYDGFDGAELDWLKLRDEVMATIDMLYDRFNDGKLSLLEYEEKKDDLLSRL